MSMPRKLSITTTEEKQRLAEEAQVKSTVVLKNRFLLPYLKVPPLFIRVF